MKGYDITFIGAGISTNFTLYKLFDKLGENNLEPLRIAVFEKSEDVWKGLPYGSRSGKNALIITKLGDFLFGNIKDEFVKWLSENKEDLLKEYAENDENNWIGSNISKIEKGFWEDLYVPRKWFGKFLEERINIKVKDARRKNSAIVDVYKADVFNIKRSVFGFECYFRLTENNNESKIICKKCVLAIGSLENRSLRINFDTTSLGKNYLFIQDPYENGLDNNINDLDGALKVNTRANNDIIIVGSNASSLEFLYNLSEKLLNKINQITVLSVTGEFPYLIKDTPNITDFVFTKLQQLSAKEKIYAKEIIECAKYDLYEAKNNGIDISLLTSLLTSKVINLINILSIQEQENFVYYYGTELVKLIRRAGYDYFKVINKLTNEGKLRLIKGQYQGTSIDRTNTNLLVEYIEDAGMNNKVENIKALINCSGFENINTTKSQLISNLILNGLIKRTNSGNGIIVDELLQSSDDFFVLGPLLAGNINSKIRLWHAESASRIDALSSDLAMTLINSFTEKICNITST